MRSRVGTLRRIRRYSAEQFAPPERGASAQGKVCGPGVRDCGRAELKGVSTLPAGNFSSAHWPRNGYTEALMRLSRG